MYYIFIYKSYTMQEQYDPRVEKRDEEVLDKQCSNNVVEEGKRIEVIFLPC